jgi:hypothetical protein
MPFRRYWIILLLHLTCQVHLILAKQLTEPKEVLNDEVNNSVLSEDLPQQLKRKLPKNKFIRWLLNCLFTIPQIPQKQVTIAAYFLHQRMYVGRIQLSKQGAWKTKIPGRKQLVHMLLPTTRDGVILDQLSFVLGGIIVPQQLIASQERLNECTYIKEAKITLQKREGSRDTVDVHIATQDRFPISLGLDSAKPSLLVTHNNLFGWGHSLENRLLYDHGLGYGAIYRAPDIKNSGVTSELQYLTAPKKGVKKASIFRNFTHQTAYAGKVEISKVRRLKKRILDGSTSPQSTRFSFYHQRIWLGTAFNTWPMADGRHGRFFLTGKVVRNQFIDRPAVAKNTNRYFHNYVFGAGSLGFSHKKHYEDQLVYGVGNTEKITYGSKVNLIGGYAFGEFISRPYLRLDITQGGRVQQLGYLYGAVNMGGFWHKKYVEQGIVQLQLRYFTPLLGVGNQWIRQFIRLAYLAGHNMFTGELISTNASKVPKIFRDPFPGGTQRLYLGLETVLFTPTRVAGCQVAALGFADAVRLQDAQGKVQQRSFCKALGIGFRCAHPCFSFGILQVKIGYAPITQNMTFTITTLVTCPPDDLDIGEPEVIPFQEY